jgi:hypothetical protein
MSAPDIPLPDDIDPAAFGDEAFFVTLPVAKIGARSRNGRVYGEAAVQSLVEQINARRPEGHWGHLDDDERSTRYEAPAVRWLAAILDEMGTVWAKCVPVTPEAREHFRIAQAANAVVGTSIYGTAILDGDEVVALELESIDLADPARVGIPEAVAPPRVTSEMGGETSPPVLLHGNGEGSPVLSPSPWGELEGGTEPTPPLAPPHGDREGSRGGEVIRELHDLRARVREMQAELETLRREKLRGEIAAVIREMVALEPLRPVVMELVGAAADAAEARTRVEAILGQPHMQALALAIVRQQAGPNVMVGAAQTPHDGLRVQDTPEARAEARTRFGL